MRFVNLAALCRFGGDSCVRTEEVLPYVVEVLVACRNRPCDDVVKCAASVGCADEVISVARAFPTSAYDVPVVHVAFVLGEESFGCSKRVFLIFGFDG